MKKTSIGGAFCEMTKQKQTAKETAISYLIRIYDELPPLEIEEAIDIALKEQAKEIFDELEKEFKGNYVMTNIGNCYSMSFVSKKFFRIKKKFLK